MRDIYQKQYFWDKTHKVVNYQAEVCKLFVSNFPQCKTCPNSLNVSIKNSRCLRNLFEVQDNVIIIENSIFLERAAAEAFYIQVSTDTLHQWFN